MPVLKLYPLLGAVSLMCLAACSPEGKQAFNDNMTAAGNNVKGAANNAAIVATNVATVAKDNVYKTSYQVQKWVVTPPEGPKPPQAIANRYCYRTAQDILCYRAPMPGAETRLVAYQGTDAEEPPQSVTQLLPMHPYDSSQQPASRVANAKPVFIGLAPEIKADSSQIPIPAQVPEQQPNPVIAPQL